MTVHKKTKQSKNKHFTDVHENIAPWTSCFYGGFPIRTKT